MSAQLETALAASKPIPASNREECHDLLERQRVTVEEHQAFRDSIATKPPADPIDELVAELRYNREGGL